MLETCVIGFSLPGLTRSANVHRPHFAPASAMLDRVRRRDAKYRSTEGAPLIRARLAGVSRREKMA